MLKYRIEYIIELCNDDSMQLVGSVDQIGQNVGLSSGSWREGSSHFRGVGSNPTAVSLVVLMREQCVTSLA